MADRRFPHRPFSEQAVAPFFGSAHEIEHHELLGGGACNSNYLVRSRSGERFVARFYSRGNPAIEQLVTGLAGDSVPVPDYLWVGEEVAVTTFVDGRHASDSPELLREAGRIIARLSRIQFPQPGEIQTDGATRPFPWGDWVTGLTELLDHSDVATRLGASLEREVRQLIVQKKDVYRDCDRHRSLVHGDFRPDNLLAASGRITGVLDWEFAHAGSPYMDIGNLLRHFGDSAATHVGSGLRDEGFPLPGDWRERAQLLDLGSHLEFLTSAHSPEFKQSCVARVADLVRRQL